MSGVCENSNPHRAHRVYDKTDGRPTETQCEGVPVSARTRLRELAEAATPGPWEAYFTRHGDPLVVEAGKGLFGAITDPIGAPVEPIVPLVRPSTSPDDYGRANCEFIAAANPSAVVELLARLDAQEAELTALRARLDRADLILHRIRVNGPTKPNLRAVLAWCRLYIPDGPVGYSQDDEGNQITPASTEGNIRGPYAHDVVPWEVTPELRVVIERSVRNPE